MTRKLINQLSAAHQANRELRGKIADLEEKLAKFEPAPKGKPGLYVDPAISKAVEGKTTDLIAHPSHYTYSKIEVLDAIEEWNLGFRLGNVVKYIARADHKGKRKEDLGKALFYLQREIAQTEGKP